MLFGHGEVLKVFVIFYKIHIPKEPLVDVHKDAGLLHRPARREREGLMDDCPDNDVDRLMFAALIRYLARPVGHQSDRRLLGLEQLIFFKISVHRDLGERDNGLRLHGVVGGYTWVY